LSGEFNENNYSLKMSKTIQSFRKDISTLRTGRANTSMLDTIKVDVYGQLMPIEQLGTISVPEARLISIQVWDKSNTSLRWVIDPIDGTANYFRGLDHCCVSIALMDKNESKVGVVYNFNNNELYSAAEGYGCYLNDLKVSVSNISDKSKASLTTGFPASETLESQYDFLDGLKNWKKIRMFGSAALSCAYVAAGKCDYYAEKGVYLWDFAAGICLVNEAGGNVEFTSIDNERYAVKFSNGKL